MKEGSAGQKFAVFDIDGTLFRWQLYHEVVFELIEGGHIPASAKRAIDAKMQEWRSRVHRHAFKDYENALLEAFLPHVPGLKTSQLEAAADRVLERSGRHVYAYTRNLINSLKKQSYHLIALSGSQNEVVQRFAKQWHFDTALGQIIEAENGAYTGTIPEDRLLIRRKGELLTQIVEENNLSWEGSIAVGDSLSDASMLALVETPIAFNPDDALFAEATKHGWKVVIERKNMAYELEQQNGLYILAEADCW